MKKLQRGNRQRKIRSRNTNITKILNEDACRAIKETLVFAVRMKKQLKENLTHLETDKKKEIFRKLLRGQLVKTYQTLHTANLKPIATGLINASLLDLTS